MLSFLNLIFGAWVLSYLSFQGHSYIAPILVNWKSLNVKCWRRFFHNFHSCWNTRVPKMIINCKLVEWGGEVLEMLKIIMFVSEKFNWCRIQVFSSEMIFLLSKILQRKWDTVSPALLTIYCHQLINKW